MKRIFFLACCAMVVAAAAHSQNAPGVTQSPPVPATPPAVPTPPERVAPPIGTTGDAPASRSDRLAEQNGVIKPPRTDPQMTVPVPREGVTPVMPVIPPPGTEGSGKKVVPK